MEPTRTFLLIPTATKITTTTPTATPTTIRAFLLADHERKRAGGSLIGRWSTRWAGGVKFGGGLLPSGTVPALIQICPETSMCRSPALWPWRSRERKEEVSNTRRNKQQRNQVFRSGLGALFTGGPTAP